MSFHVLHIFRHGARLSKERGRLFCKAEDFQQSLPLDNIRAVIIAARGVSMSSSVISSLMAADAIVLHCGERYQPVGITRPMVRTINQRLLNGQINPARGFNRAAWMEVLQTKVCNQAMVLGWLSPGDNPMANFEVRRPEDEGMYARVYFRKYFKELSALGQNRSRRHEGWLNDMLNYGYAVLAALVHRATVVHGLLPNIGIHHKPRYRADPLVYDLMEPFRPVVDALVAGFSRNVADPDMERFARFLGINLREVRLSGPNYSLKFMDWIDLTVRSFANACETNAPKLIKLPGISSQILEQTTARLWPES